MKLRRLLCLLLSFCIIFSAVGCSKVDVSSDTSSDANSQSYTPMDSEQMTSDDTDSFNESVEEDSDDNSEDSEYSDDITEDTETELPGVDDEYYDPEEDSYEEEETESEEDYGEEEEESEETPEEETEDETESQPETPENDESEKTPVAPENQENTQTPENNQNTQNQGNTNQPEATPEADKISVEVEKLLKPLTAEDDMIMQDNPDRGFRTHLTLYVNEAVEAIDPMDYYQSKYNIFFGYCDMDINVSMTYLYLTEYRGMDIPPEAMDAIEQFFKYSEIKQFTSCLRFAYCDDYTKLDRGADQATIIRHIKQLAPLIQKYKHCVHTVEGGFVGSYGEWAPVYQSPPVDYETITNYLLKYFCLPNGVYLSLRLPSYKNLLPSTHPYLKYIGFHNDAMFGEQTRLDWNSGGYQLGTPEWEQACTEGAYTPQGGEMLNNNTYHQRDMIPKGIEMIMEAGHHWQNTMSAWHGKYEGTGEYEPIMEIWEREPVTPEIIEQAKVVYDPNWFYDKNGNPVERNAFEFLRDHLGYRISLQALKISGESKPGGVIDIQLPLKNYGFSAAFCLNSGFAILDSDYNVVSTKKAGKPSTWYSHDPENYLDTTIRTYNVKSQMKLPSKSGKYYIAFYLKNGLNHFATFANDIETADGYAILHEFVI